MVVYSESFVYWVLNRYTLTMCFVNAVRNFDVHFTLLWNVFIETNVLQFVIYVFLYHVLYFMCIYLL